MQGRRRASAHAVAFAGFSGATFTNATNAAAIFVPLKPVRGALKAGLLGRRDHRANLQKRLQPIQEAFIIAMPPPPVRGIGNAGGFKMQLQERAGRRAAALLAAAYAA